LATDPINWQSLLFQTGYLTLKKEYFEQQLVTLAYPNREVELSMNSYLLATFRNGLPDDSVPFFQNLKNALQSAQIPEFITLINALFASIPYQLFDQKREGFFHAILHLTFKGIGLFVQSEVSTSKGRVDCVVQLQDHVYVIEFKLDASAKDALDQIREKRYGTSFLGAGKKVVALGINFSSSTRTIESWEAVDYTQLLTEG
ncbi:MAG: PD-(D/E)XK nuclease domain-containing protein, partial [Bacteroidota bacterium]